jgi:hypothetical protein
MFSKGSTAIDLSIGLVEVLKSDGKTKYPETNSPIIMNDQKAILNLKLFAFTKSGVFTDTIFLEGDSFF